MGWIIALVILFLLAILPLGATVRYNAEGLQLSVIAGPARIGIIPKKKTEKEKAPKKKEKKPAKSGKTASSKSEKPATKEKGGSWTDFLPLVKVALDFLNSFRKKIRVNQLALKLILAGDDPCDLAVNYGKAWAAVGNLMPQLERCFVIRKRDVEVECDFETTQTLVIARLDITITLGRLLCLLAVYGYRGIKEFLKLKKIQKGGNNS